MAVTALGKRYARRLNDKTISLIEIRAERVKDALDSYIELFGEAYKEE